MSKIYTAVFLFILYFDDTVFASEQMPKTFHMSFCTADDAALYGGMGPAMWPYAQSGTCSLGSETATLASKGCEEVEPIVQSVPYAQQLHHLAPAAWVIIDTVRSTIQNLLLNVMQISTAFSHTSKHVDEITMVASFIGYLAAIVSIYAVVTFFRSIRAALREAQVIARAKEVAASSSTNGAAGSIDVADDNAAFTREGPGTIAIEKVELDVAEFATVMDEGKEFEAVGFFTSTPKLRSGYTSTSEQSSASGSDQPDIQASAATRLGFNRQTAGSSSETSPVSSHRGVKQQRSSERQSMPVSDAAAGRGRQRAELLNLVQESLSTTDHEEIASRHFATVPRARAIAAALLAGEDVLRGQSVLHRASADAAAEAVRQAPAFDALERAASHLRARIVTADTPQSANASRRSNLGSNAPFSEAEGDALIFSLRNVINLLRRNNTKYDGASPPLFASIEPPSEYTISSQLCTDLQEVLVWASGAGDKDLVSAILAFDSEVNSRISAQGICTSTSRQGDGLVLLATNAQISGLTGTELVVELLEWGACPNVRSTRGGHTALHLAAASGDLELFKMLVDSGAHIGIQNAYGHTPAQVAEAYAHDELLNYIESRH